LLPGTLTPSLQEDLVRLGAWMPFEPAAQALGHFRRVDVSRPTAERLTEAAGAAYVAVQTAEVERIERELPPPPPGPAKQFLSVDGAFVPIVGGEWAEVKTLVIGEVQPPLWVHGEPVLHTTQLSYFSRLTDSDTFQRLALVETQRRGVETAPALAAVTDGAEWIQKFLDQHRADALRILDFPHAGEYVSAIGQAAFGEGTPQAQGWWAEQLHCLKHDGPESVLATIRQLARQQPACAEISDRLAYLEKRAPHMDYPAYQQAGWPIGDGAVESGNKLVVEARLKGSGMHWARAHVDPMLALRNVVCNDRWEEAWPQITHTLRQQALKRRLARHPQPSPAQPAAAPEAPRPPAADKQPASAAIAPPPPDTAAAPTASPPPRRPAANHPWRRMLLGRARYASPRDGADAKS
jgi:hypothetical protein